MKLYTRAQNSAGERVRIALNLKGIAYEYVAVSTLGPGEYARINPQQLLPALEADGRVITQSAAILHYLEAAFPSGRYCRPIRWCERRPLPLARWLPQRCMH